MNWIMEYTADSSRMLKEWRSAGTAPREFVEEVRKHQRYQGICWRGTSLRSLSEFSPVLSSSREIQVAFDFSSNHYEAAIVAFVGYEAYNISKSSVHPEEDEVVLILPEMFEAYRVAWLEGTQVYLACNAKNLPLWEKEVKYQVARFQSFLTDYDL